MFGGVSLTVYRNLSPNENLNSTLLVTNSSTAGLDPTVVVEPAHFSPTGTGFLIPSPASSVSPAMSIFGVGMGAESTETVGGNGSAGGGYEMVVSNEGDGGRELKWGLSGVLGVVGFVFWAL